MKQPSCDEAFLLAVNFAKLPSVPAADIERHSAVDKYGQPRRLSARNQQIITEN